MIETLKLQTGDILLFPTKLGTYQYVQSIFGKKFANKLMKWSGNDYIHAEIMFDSTYTMLGGFEGVHVVKHSLPTLSQLTILRVADDIDKQKMQNVMLELWNKKYDFASLFKNGIQELANQFKAEKIVEKFLNEDRPEQLICSEVVARTYEKYGLPLTNTSSEWVSPQDIFDSPLTKVVYQNKSKL